MSGWHLVYYPHSFQTHHHHVPLALALALALVLALAPMTLQGHCGGEGGVGRGRGEGRLFVMRGLRGQYRLTGERGREGGREG